MTMHVRPFDESYEGLTVHFLHPPEYFLQLKTVLGEWWWVRHYDKLIAGFTIQT